MSGVQRFVQPDYSDVTQDGTTYAVYHDRAVAVFKRLGDWFAPHQVYAGSPQPDLAVELDAGWTLDGTTKTEVAAQTVTGFTIPAAGQHRVDRVVVDASTGVAARVAGTAATGSPSATAPAIPTGKLPVCQVFIQSSDTAILDSMITDERALPTIAAGAATTSAAGIVELLTQAEYDAGADTTRVPTASLNRLALSTPQASTSGVAIDFTGIPSGTRRLIIEFAGVSGNGTSVLMVQVGDAGGFENTGYSGHRVEVTTGVSGANYGGTGFELFVDQAAAIVHGTMVLTLQNSSTNTWVCGASVGRSDASRSSISNGSKSLSQELTQVRITFVNGTDAFDLGAINLIAER